MTLSKVNANSLFTFNRKKKLESIQMMQQELQASKLSKSDMKSLSSTCLFLTGGQSKKNSVS
jgi:hypothetical protein